MRDRRSLRKTDLIHAPQRSPPTNKDANTLPTVLLRTYGPAPRRVTNAIYLGCVGLAVARIRSRRWAHDRRHSSRSHSTTASASNSISQSGSMKRVTCMMVLAGRIAPKYSPCTAATACQSSILVSSVRVRTT